MSPDPPAQVAQTIMAGYLWPFAPTEKAWVELDAYLRECATKAFDDAEGRTYQTFATEVLKVNEVDEHSIMHATRMLALQRMEITRENETYMHALIKSIVFAAAMRGDATLIHEYLKVTPAHNDDDGDNHWDCNFHTRVVRNMVSLSSYADTFADLANEYVPRLYEYKYPKTKTCGQYTDPATDTILLVMDRAGKCSGRKTLQYFIDSFDRPVADIHRRVWFRDSHRIMTQMHGALADFAGNAVESGDVDALRWVLGLRESDRTYVRDFANTVKDSAISALKLKKRTAESDGDATDVRDVMRAMVKESK